MGYSARQTHDTNTIWEARLRDFLHECVSSAATEEEERIREGASLLLRLGGGDRQRIDPMAIEAMLASGAGESAVFELLGPNVPFIVSRGGSGTCLATLVLPDGADEVMAEGATLALALLAAHFAFLAQEIGQSDTLAGLAGKEPASRLH